MSDVPFYKTRMGHQFYDRTMPALVKQLERLTEILGELTTPSTRDSECRKSEKHRH